MKTAKQILQDAKARIQDPARWIRHVWTIRCDGVVKECAHYALQQAGEHNTPENAKAWYAIWAAANNSTLSDYNDTHTHAEVMALFDRAMEVV